MLLTFLVVRCIEDKLAFVGVAFFYQNQTPTMNNDKKTGNHAPCTISTPHGDFSTDFLFHAAIVQEKKLHFARLLADMQRIFLIDVAKNHTFPDEHFDQLEANLKVLQEMIFTA